MEQVWPVQNLLIKMEMCKILGSLLAKSFHSIKIWRPRVREYCKWKVSLRGDISPLTNGWTEGHLFPSYRWCGTHLIKIFTWTDECILLTPIIRLQADSFSGYANTQISVFALSISTWSKESMEQLDWEQVNKHWLPLHLLNAEIEGH